MELLLKLLEFFKATDGTSKLMLLWAAFVGIVMSMRAFLVILAPMTKTTIDDKMLGLISKVYDMIGKPISHENPKKEDPKETP